MCNAGLFLKCVKYLKTGLVCHSDTHTHTLARAHTDTKTGSCVLNTAKPKHANMITLGVFFHMNTDALHVSTRRLTSFQHEETLRYTHQCIMGGGFFVVVVGFLSFFLNIA